MTDHDLRNLQARGAEVLILEPGYTADALKEARAECKKLTDKTPNQTPVEVTLETASTPPGADIELDGTFVGSTPSSVSVSLGEHTVKLIKTGYSPWERKIKITGGNIKISPDLDPLAPTPGK